MAEQTKSSFHWAIKASLVVVLLAALALAALALAAIRLQPDRVEMGSGDKPFDRAAWLDSGGDYQMCDDVIKNHVHIGMSRDEVIALLGVPEDNLPRHLGWDVGGMPLGYWLNMVLDERGRVTRVFLETY